MSLPRVDLPRVSLPTKGIEELGVGGESEGAGEVAPVRPSVTGRLAVRLGGELGCGIERARGSE